MRFPFRPLLLIALVVAAGVELTKAEVNRGLWFWGSTTTPAGPSPYGSIQVVGDPALEDESIAFFNSHGVKRIYGSYQNRPVSDSAAIAAWNLKLEYALIESQLLLDGTEVNDPVWMAGFLDKVQTRLIDFNNGLYDDLGSKFDALHLDLEPQGLALWQGAGGTPAVKRALLDNLAQAYADVRALLVTGGLGTLPIYADIHFAWDKLPADGGSVGWADAADRDAWYAGIGASLNGVSVMTFSKDTAPELEVATLYERTGSFSGFARIGIQPKGWTGQMWTSIWQVNSVLTELEAAHAPDYATDLENYGFWRYSIEASELVVIGVEVDIAILVDDPGTPIGGGVVVPVLEFEGDSDHTYFVLETDDLAGSWKELQQVAGPREGERNTLRVTLPAGSGKKKFYRVVESSREVAQ